MWLTWRSEVTLSAILKYVKYMGGAIHWQRDRHLPTLYEPAKDVCPMHYLHDLLPKPQVQKSSEP